MTVHNYFYLVKSLRVLLKVETDERKAFQIIADQFVEVVDQRKSATVLPGWVLIRVGPNDMLLAKRSELEASEKGLTAAQFQSAVSER